MSRIDFEPWEPEESVGKLWHAFASRLDGDPIHDGARVSLSEVAGRLAVLFRGLGGDPAVEIKPVAEETSHHRLSLLRRLGTWAEAAPRASFDGATLRLPETLAAFPDPRANAALYLWLAAIYITSLVLANIIGVKLFTFPLELGPLGTLSVEHTMGMLPFPITFLLTDLINEYYGKRGARRVVYVALAMAAFAWVMIWISRKVPTLEGIPGTATSEAFENVFGAASLMYIASLIAFLCGSLLDIFLFGFFKRLTNGRMVWLRATGSTIISQLFDSFVVTFVFFLFIPVLRGGEPAAVGWIFGTALTGYILKFVLAVLVTPLIYVGRWIIREWFGMRALPATNI